MTLPTLPDSSPGLPAVAQSRIRDIGLRTGTILQLSPLIIDISGVQIVSPGLLTQLGNVGDSVVVMRDRGSMVVLGTPVSDDDEMRVGRGLVAVDQDNASSATVSFGAPQTILSFTATFQPQRAYKLEFGNRTTFSGATAVANYDITVNGSIVGQFRFGGNTGVLAGVYSGGVTYAGRYSNVPQTDATVELVLTSLVTATTVFQTGSSGGRRWLAMYDVGPVHNAYLQAIPV